MLEKTVGLKKCFNVSQSSTVWYCFGVLGAAEDCLNEAFHYTKERIMFKKNL